MAPYTSWAVIPLVPPTNFLFVKESYEPFVFVGLVASYVGDVPATKHVSALGLY